MRILILGGTAEAREIAGLVARDGRFNATLSLAGVTTNPLSQPLPTRSGGFGGKDGLVAWMREQQIACVVDATHPYADEISTNAVAACNELRRPLISFDRQPWVAEAGDKWISVPNAGEAASTLGPKARRVFLAVGSVSLPEFSTAAHHTYVARIIDAPKCEIMPPNITFLFDRGPFNAADETSLLTRHRIEVIVSKNSGGPSTNGKIQAARILGLPVIMIARPVKPHGIKARTPEDVYRALLGEAGHHRDGASSLRGV